MISSTGEINGRHEQVFYHQKYQLHNMTVLSGDIVYQNVNANS